MDYKNGDSKTFAKADTKFVAVEKKKLCLRDQKLTARVGGRVLGVKDRYGIDASLLEADAIAGFQYGVFGAGAKAAVGAQVLHFKNDDATVSVRVYGGDLKASAGFDIKALIKEGHAFGAKVEARATLIEAKIGPVGVHIGAGVSSGATVEEGTVDAKLAGYGLKVGKRVGVSVFDTEISLETLSLVGKGWLW